MIPADYRKLSDEELVFRYAHKHEHAALIYLFERYAHIVTGVCANYTGNINEAKDATQKIFLQLTEDLITYKIEKFKPWLFQKCRNYCLLNYKGFVRVDNNMALSEDFEEDWQYKIEEAHMAGILRPMVSALDSAQHTCIELFYLQNLTYKAIAEKTGYDISTVKTSIVTGIRNLKKQLVASGKVKL